MGPLALVESVRRFVIIDLKKNAKLDEISFESVMTSP